MLLTGTLTVDGLTFRTVQASPAAELLDDLLITRFPATPDEPAFVRVAVFDPAENVAIPASRVTAQRAVAVARQWFRTERDPIAALHGAAAELHEPHRPADANPLTTAAWVDVHRDGDRVLILDAGRCADAEIAITDNDLTRRLLTTPMLNPSALATLDTVVSQARHGMPAHRRMARGWHARLRFLQESDWTNPPLGLTAVPRPELSAGSDLPLAAASVLVATDGLELAETLPDPGRFDLAEQLAHLTTRPAPHGHPWPHGDLAAVRIATATD